MRAWVWAHKDMILNNEREIEGGYNKNKKSKNAYKYLINNKFKIHIKS